MLAIIEINNCPECPNFIDGKNSDWGPASNLCPYITYQRLGRPITESIPNIGIHPDCPFLINQG